MDEKELQEKIELYRLLEARVNGMMKQRELVMNKMLEIKTTMGSLSEMEKSQGEILFPIGSEAWSSTKVLDKDRIIVEIGAGVAVEKSFAQAKDVLDKRIAELETAVEEINRELSLNAEKLEKLGPEINDMIGKMQAG